MRKTAIVTGSSKGIGKAIAEKLAAEGYDLLLCARNNERLQQTVQQLRDNFPSVNVEGKSADLSVKGQVCEFGEWCLAISTPDILVNNAGIYLPGKVSDERDGHLEEMMAANLYSAYWLTRLLLPAMKAAHSGHIFNMCSVASLHAYEGGGGYSISKFALNGFSQNLRHELKDEGIKVTTVFPGAVFTDSWAGFDNSTGRIMEAEDIANMIAVAARLSPQANVDEIIIRPLKGDL